MTPRKWVIFIIVLCFSFTATAQRFWDGENNRIGVQAGANQFTILTEDFPVSPLTSWTGGFTTRSDFHENFQWVYGITFFNMKSQITGREKQDGEVYEQVDFNMTGVQANFFGSYKIWGDHWGFEGGPVLQLNGRYDARQDKDFYYIQGYDIQASDLKNVSAFNFNMAAVITGGFENFKLWVQYQYGINNFFRKLNEEGLESKDPDATNLNGHIRIISAGLAIYL